jgi:ABC-type multidrug transport system fused ATPase/permease subunit
VHELLDTPVEVKETGVAVALPAAHGEVTFDNVTFTFHRGGTVLDGVQLEVRAGERVAIVGPSGVGKSTIADLLVRHVDPDSGRILLDGHDLRTLRLADLRRHIVVVDQEPFVFNASIAENIRYARPDASDEHIVSATKAAGLSSLIERSPLGIETTLGERGRALSAGERQRVAIARALLADPAVLVLDEATGALDPATEAQVVAGYETLMHGRTTILITHRLELARRADRIVMLDAGRIAHTGTAEALLAESDAFADLFAAVPRGE